MSEYYQDIAKRAEGFVEENEYEIIKALIDEDNCLFDNDSLVEALSCDLPPLTIGDAAVVVEESANPADDPGLWEGLNPMDAIISMGTFTMEQDLREDIDEIYQDMLSDYQDAMLEDENEGGEDEVAQQIFDEWKMADMPKQKTPGTQEEKSLIERWLRMSSDVGMRGGNPLGESYIDMRCGTGYSQPDQLRYVNFDHEMANMYPHLRGMYRRHVEEYYNKTFGDQSQCAEA